MTSEKLEIHDELAPSAWVRRFAPLVAEGARILDVAAGRGRHARFFAARNAHVIAVDRDAEALAALRSVSGVTTRVADLEGAEWPFAGDTFDAILVVNYLHRPLLPALLQSLAPDGVLIYETFAVGNERFGRPSNPAFLLREDELLALARAELVIVAFEQGEVAADRRAVMQRVAAVGRARPWPPPLPA
ncbi:MAG TPA: class I SAM-dependent methyltransferase [Casimicrobiaceae bacterium]|nr:class I SAM-dependent methyltransferase [Casimicrobiaceae bacterium]